MKKSKLVSMNDLEQIRKELGNMFLREKLEGDKISDTTIKYSQYLDIPIAIEQRKRLEEYKKTINTKIYA